MKQNVSEYIPMRVVKSWRGVGSFIMIDLSAPKKSDEFIRSVAWRIWIYLCDWELINGNNTIIDSSCDDQDKYEEKLAILSGKWLINIKYDDDMERCVLEFSNDLSITMDDASDLYGINQKMVKFYCEDEFVSAFVSGIGMQDGSLEPPP